MTQNILWVSLILLMLATILPEKKIIKSKIAGIGWILFGIYIGLNYMHYSEVGDYVNVFLSISASILSIFIGYILLINDKKLNQNFKKSIFMATTAAAFGGISYFIFSNIKLFNEWLISTVTDQTIWLGSVLGIMITKIDWNIVAVNGYKVEIILACTAIESIALYIGIIASVKPPLTRFIKAFIISIPTIYILNLIRNVFVVEAYGNLWFGDPDTSFYIAHTIIAKTGSLLALFIISYYVLKILPEIIDMIDGIIGLVKTSIRNAG